MTDDQHPGSIAVPPPSALEPSPTATESDPVVPPSPAAPPPPAHAAPPAGTRVGTREGTRGVSAHAVFAPSAARAAERARRRDAPHFARTPALVFAASIALTIAAAAFAAVSGSSRDDARFANAVQSARDRVVNRLAIYLALLDGARALFAASEQVSAAEFREYIHELELLRRYPGIQGIGYSRLLNPPGAPSDPASLAAALHAGGSLAPRVWPDSARLQYHAIVYLEPLDERNRAALGFDMFSEPTRRDAMERARDSGSPVSTGIVTLKQEISPDKQAGFLVYLPVYAPGRPPTTLDARRRTLRGFVYAPIRAGDLFTGIFGSEAQPEVAFRVFDGADTTAAALLFDSRSLGLPRAHGTSLLDRGRAGRLAAIDVYGRQWTLAFSPLPVDDIGTGPFGALWIALFGTAVSVALYYATRAEVHARRAAERSDAQRARFFAAMSHELRTPINAIMGYNDLILTGVYGPVSGAQQDGLVRSQRAAKHLLELVSDVLDVSKLEAGKVEVATETVALDEFLDDLLVTIQPVADEQGCHLRLEGRGNALSLRTDPRRLRQILLNLLSNATKFAAGHPITVWYDVHAAGRPIPGAQGSRREERRWTHGEAVVVAVRDEGPGIAPADQERIFEEFVQLPGSTPGGTGLGLPISRRLAELLGGTLSLDSAPGRGSTFYVTLPRVPRRERARHHV